VDLHNLLGTSFDCECGRRHTVPTEHFLLDPEAVERMADAASTCVPYPEYLVVADERTYDVAGRAIEDALKKRDATVSRLIVPDRDGQSPVTDDKTRDWILSRAPSTEMYVAVGSGVINDLTKWVAHERNKPFMTLATAASMNGYASANVSATVEGLKVLFHARAGKGVFGVPAVIENAPFVLTASGLGDVVAKSVSSADWRLNEFLFDEYYCQFSVDLLKDLEPVYLNHPEKIRKRDPEAIGALFRALFWSSIAMTITGTSAPASGGEHLVSHTLDMYSAAKGRRHDLHGRQVGVGTILSAALYERILQIERPEVKRIPSDVDRSFWGPLADVVQAEYEKKRPKLDLAAQKLATPRAWDTLRALVKKNLLSPRKLKNCLQQAGAAHRVSDLRIDDESIAPELFLQVWKNARQMRERFTVLDLAFLLGVLPEQGEDILSEWVIS
jgi:glycerol-1-phosphate dehydrogenase [NAD(P)+]